MFPSLRTSRSCKVRVVCHNVGGGPLCSWYLFDAWSRGEASSPVRSPLSQWRSRPPGPNASGWRSERNRTFPGSVLLLTAGDTPCVLGVRRGLPSDSATELNRKGLICSQLGSLKGIPFSFLFSSCVQPAFNGYIRDIYLYLYECIAGKLYPLKAVYIQKEKSQEKGYSLQRTNLGAYGPFDSITLQSIYYTYIYIYKLFNKS